MMGCLEVCSGMDYQFFERIAAHSNEYARIHMNTNGQYAGSNWSNITVEEMVRFLGIILKMSINNRELGGYASYFANRKSVNLGRRYYVELNDYPAWADQGMSLHSFKQICTSIHPEIGTSIIGDKCHQLRHVLNTFNQACQWMFTNLDMIFSGVGLLLGQGSILFVSTTNNKYKLQKF